MEERDSSKREDAFSKPVRAGKRTYFFDVKSTRGEDFYLTITESKRKLESNGKFSYTKHKLFIYKEDFDKFAEGLADAIEFVRNQKGADYGREEYDGEISESEPAVKIDAPAANAAPSGYSSDISFDDLGDFDKF
ncbi:MAG: PUR family DNA/RNA-binding protein [Flavobacteriales bacterium]|nr:PUR family DNA/RNA-binding protein [Flavobacteriales bacterium]